MFIDSREVVDGGVLEADLCIIGAGAAGISIALELIGSGLDVLLLESGGLDLDAPTQALYEGENTGFPYYPLNALRLRYFGGTTNHWAGACRTLDEIDFQRRAWIPDSGWPIEHGSLQRWYERAHALCEIGGLDYDPDGWEQDGRTRLAVRPDRIETQMFRISPPTRFGPRYGDALRKAANIRVCLWANVTDVSTVPEGHRVDAVSVRTLVGTNFTVRARRFVLATGALENARLLLASRQGQQQGVGNAEDCVGRYFMEHLAADAALLLPADPGFQPNLYIEHSRHRRDNVEGKAFLVARPEVQQREQLLNGRVFLRAVPEYEWLRADSSGGIEAIGAVKDALRGDGEATRLSQHLHRTLAAWDDALVYSYRRLFRPPGRDVYLALNCHIEQAPNRESRVMLGDEHDALGLPRLKLDWRFGDLERRTLDRLPEIVGEELGYAGIGRIRMIEPSVETGWPPRLRGAWHQMGTTRMSSDSRQGVVDANSAVHGVPNLYLAGSSVFPTSGYTNPTLTIVALAARLADHLRQGM